MKKPCCGCGREIGSADKFCTYCGAMQKAESAAINSDAIPNDHNKQENQTTFAEDKKQFPLTWLYFNLIIRFPLGMLAGFGNWSTATYQYEQASIPVPMISTVLFWGSMLLTLMTIIQGFRFKKSGYALLIFMFIIDPFSLMYANVIMNPNAQPYWAFPYLLLFLVIWTLPNLIYINKRRSLFGYSADTKAAEKKNVTIINIDNASSQNVEESETVSDALVQRNSSEREPVNKKGPSSLRMFIIAVLLIAITIIYGSLIV